MGAFLNDVHHISLCSGIGGLDLGVSRCIRGFRTVAYVEGEAFACGCLVKAMEANELDEAPIYSDVRSFPFERFHGIVDVVSGGFPCQPFSSAGQRKGTEDPRHLWPSIKRGLGECLPRVAFFENVDGILHAKSEGYHCVLHHVLSDLEELGYRATAARFSAREVGAPHRRRRWFILGVRNAYREGEPTITIDEEASRMRGAMADTQGDVRWTGKREAEKGTWKDQERGGVFAVGGQRLADSRSGRRQNRISNSSEYGAESEKSRDDCARYPNGPGPQHEDEPPRVLESGMGGNSHGLPDRVDRLRALGNAVVPEVAEKAFRTLWGRLHD